MALSIDIKNFEIMGQVTKEESRKQVGIKVTALGEIIEGGTGDEWMSIRAENPVCFGGIKIKSEELYRSDQN